MEECMTSKQISLLVLGMLVVMAIGGLIAQSTAPTVTIKIDFVSNDFITADTTLRATGKSIGLNNTGIGETVYLHAEIIDSNATYQWTLAGPTGSTATLSSTTNKKTNFRPDTMGIYTVYLTATNAQGTAKDTMKVNAAKYVGVGAIGGLTATLPQCGLGCHQEQYAKWIKTGHATQFSRLIDDPPANHYSTNCISCHTVGYNSLATAINDGFDDIAKALGWAFPTTKGNNWQNVVTNYPTLAQRANIQCENCHGAGSAHTFRAGAVERSKIAVTYDVNPCANCHDAQKNHVYYDEWAKSRHATASSSRNRSGCAQCHTAKGFVEEQIKGNTSAAPYEDGVPITCTACHDPHGGPNEKQIRKMSDVTLLNNVTITEGGMGKLCMNCHHARREANSYVTEYHSNYGPHYSNQADMLAGTNAVEFGLKMPSSGHIKGVENTCVTCHMTNYESTEPGYQNQAEHTFKMSSISGKDTLDNVKSCKTCHGSSVKKFEDIKAAEDYDGNGKVEGAQTEISGLLKQLGGLLPPDGPSVTVTNKYAPMQLKAAYNYLFIQEDGSDGVHNTAYAASILKASIRALTTGDIGAEKIISISDVPNDQGKQVRVQWNRFPGDGQSDNPITKYGVWRRIDDMKLGKNAQKVESYEEMFSTLGNVAAGAQFAVGATAELWDFVKDVPATAEAQYSTICATLFDSTKTSGQKWSVFYISGHAKDGVTVVKSAKDSGYSADNLSPKAPLPLVANKAAGKVTVEWTQSEDKDFNFYNVYRGTAQDFNPSATQAVGRLADTKFTEVLSTTGQKYYYRITAVDFSGNESTYSLEISEDNVITSINSPNTSGIPNEFGLAQNYPNPFNPTTMLQYALPANAHVTLQIFDILGRQVRALVSEYSYAGYHEVMWDGRDNNGALVSSGIYIYRIQAGRFSSTKKMILMK